MKPNFVYVIWIQSTAAKVFEALRDPEMTKDYWGRSRNVSDWQQGSEWSNVSYDDPKVVDVKGKVIEIDPPRRLVLGWETSMPTHVTSTVTFVLEEQFGSVKLTVTHEGLPPGPALEMASMGWTSILSSLKTLLETGHAMPQTMRRWGR